MLFAKSLNLISAKNSASIDLLEKIFTSAHLSQISTVEPRLSDHFGTKPMPDK